jgi:hypothetical protein
MLTNPDLAFMWACVLADRELRIFVYDPCQSVVANATRLIRANPAIARTQSRLAEAASHVGRITDAECSACYDRSDGSSGAGPSRAQQFS